MVDRITKNENERNLGLYIHIPFCVKKCDYCDFLSAPATDAVKREYFDAIMTEIESYRDVAQDYTVPTIFIGGGTPSCVEAEYIFRIMETVRTVFRIDEIRLEATIEVNPGTLTREKLMVYRAAGFNRLSFGLQSTNNDELKLLGRIHTYEQFLDNYYLAREVGFDNINIDLMSALPGQTLSAWEETLNKIITLKPEHISAYSLIIEEGTQFYERYREGAKQYRDLPDEETDRQIYHRTKELLNNLGYHRYEISNYAKIGHECAHNCSYWIGTDYLGIGLGAASLLNSARFVKMHDIKQYIQRCNAYKQMKSDKNANNLRSNVTKREIHDLIGLAKDYDCLSFNQQMEEFMFLGLRMCKGISKSAFYMRFQKDIDHVYGDVIKKLISDKLLIEDGDYIRLSEYGMDVSNSVFYVFLLN